MKSKIMMMMSKIMMKKSKIMMRMNLYQRRRKKRKNQPFHKIRTGTGIIQTTETIIRRTIITIIAITTITIGTTRTGTTKMITSRKTKTGSVEGMEVMEATVGRRVGFSVNKVYRPLYLYVHISGLYPSARTHANVGKNWLRKLVGLLPTTQILTTALLKYMHDVW